MTTTPAGALRPGQKIRCGNDPFFREVDSVYVRGDGFVEVEIRVGGLMEKLRPMPETQRVETVWSP